MVVLVIWTVEVKVVLSVASGCPFLRLGAIDAAAAAATTTGSASIVDCGWVTCCADFVNCRNMRVVVVVVMRDDDDDDDENRNAPLRATGTTTTTRLSTSSTVTLWWLRQWGRRLICVNI